MQELNQLYVYLGAGDVVAQVAVLHTHTDATGMKMSFRTGTDRGAWYRQGEVVTKLAPSEEVKAAGYWVCWQQCLEARWESMPGWVKWACGGSAAPASSAVSCGPALCVRFAWASGEDGVTQNATDHPHPGYKGYLAGRGSSRFPVPMGYGLAVEPLPGRGNRRLGCGGDHNNRIVPRQAERDGCAHADRGGSSSNRPRTGAPVTWPVDFGSKGVLVRSKIQHVAYCYTYVGCTPSTALTPSSSGPSNG